MTTHAQAQPQHSAFVYAPLNWRAGLSVCLSVGVHAALLALLFHFASPSAFTLPDAGRAGGAISLMLVPVAVQQEQTTPAPAEPPQQAEEQPKAVVVEKAEIIVAKKVPSREKPVKQSEPRKPSENVRTPTQPVEKPRRTEPAPRIPASPTPASTGASAAQSTPSPATASSASRVGESDSGNAAQGAGRATSAVVRILHRRVNYPNRARSMGLEGQVKVKFDITASGTITNIRILSENPPDVFSGELRRDISRWRYVTTGRVNDQVVTVIFKIDGRIQVIS